MANTEIEIIAECAQGFEGKGYLANLLAEGAGKAGAHYIKYQLVYADELSVPSYKYYDLFKSLEMKDSEWIKVVSILKHYNTKLLFDVFGLKSLSKAKQFGAHGVKITTTDFFDFDLTKKALSLFPKVFLSIGGIHLHEIKEFIEGLDKKLLTKLVVLNGFQAEPTPLNKNNLSRFHSLKKEFLDLDFGFMDHIDGDSNNKLNLSLIALGAGVKYIEKHITLSRVLMLEDYVSAINLDELKEFVKMIHEFSFAMGDQEFKLSVDETQYRSRAQKVVVAVKNIKKGTKIVESDIALKRVKNIPGVAYYTFKSDVVGSIADQDYEINQALLLGNSN